MNCSTLTFIVLSSYAVRVKSSYTMGIIISHIDASPFSASCRLLMKRLKHNVSAGIRNDGAPGSSSSFLPISSHAPLAFY